MRNQRSQQPTRPQASGSTRNQASQPNNNSIDSQSTPSNDTTGQRKSTRQSPPNPRYYSNEYVSKRTGNKTEIQEDAIEEGSKEASSSGSSSKPSPAENPSRVDNANVARIDNTEQASTPVSLQGKDEEVQGTSTPTEEKTESSDGKPRASETTPRAQRPTDLEAYKDDSPEAQTGCNPACIMSPKEILENYSGKKAPRTERAPELAQVQQDRMVLDTVIGEATGRSVHQVPVSETLHSPVPNTPEGHARTSLFVFL